MGFISASAIRKQIARPVVERAVDGNDVGAAEEVLERQAGIARNVEIFPRRRGIGDARAEGGGNVGYAPADGAHADDAELQAGEFVKFTAQVGEHGACRVTARLYEIVVVARGVQKIEKHGEGALRDRLGGIAGPVFHGHAFLRRIVQITVVHAGGDDADELQLRTGVKDVAVDSDFVGDDNIVSPDALDAARGRGVGYPVYSPSDEISARLSTGSTLTASRKTILTGLFMTPSLPAL